MRTEEDAEELRDEILNRLGILKRFLTLEIEQDFECDGGEFYIRIQ